MPKWQLPRVQTKEQHVDSKIKDMDQPHPQTNRQEHQMGNSIHRSGSRIKKAIYLIHNRPNSYADPKATWATEVKATLRLPLWVRSTNKPEKGRRIGSLQGWSKDRDRREWRRYTQWSNIQSVLAYFRSLRTHLTSLQRRLIDPRQNPRLRFQMINLRIIIGMEREISGIIWRNLGLRLPYRIWVQVSVHPRTRNNRKLKSRTQKIMIRWKHIFCKWQIWQRWISEMIPDTSNLNSGTTLRQAEDQLWQGNHHLPLLGSRKHSASLHLNQDIHEPQKTGTPILPRKTLNSISCQRKEFQKCHNLWLNWSGSRRISKQKLWPSIINTQRVRMLNHR